MTLTKLVKMIEREQALKAKIDDELKSWCTPRGYTDSPLRCALRTFGKGSLRQNAAALGVSPTYLSQVERGHMVASRGLMVAVHNTFGLGAVKGEGGG